MLSGYGFATVVAPVCFVASRVEVGSLLLRLVGSVALHLGSLVGIGGPLLWLSAAESRHGGVQGAHDLLVSALSVGSLRTNTAEAVEQRSISRSQVLLPLDALLG